MGHRLNNYGVFAEVANAAFGSLGTTAECDALSKDMDKTYTSPWRKAGYPQSGKLFDKHKAGQQRVRNCNLKSQGQAPSALPPLGTKETADAKKGIKPKPADTSLAPSSKPFPTFLAIGGILAIVGVVAWRFRPRGLGL